MVNGSGGVVLTALDTNGHVAEVVDVLEQRAVDLFFEAEDHGDAERLGKGAVA